MRATLHDELMGEAGFETDYHRELEGRRAPGYLADVVAGPAAVSDAEDDDAQEDPAGNQRADQEHEQRQRVDLPGGGRGLGWRDRQT